MEYQKRDMLVGIFVLVAIGLLAAIIIVKQGFSFGYYPIRVAFGSITNINEGTKVRLKGYEIGRVERINFYYEPKDPRDYRLDEGMYKEGIYFIVELAIKNEYQLHKGVKVKIKSSGVVGDNFLDLDTSEQEASILPPGAIIRGEDVFDMSIFLVKTREMIEGVTDMARGGTDMAKGIHAMAQNIKEAEFGGKVGRFVEVIRKISDDFKHLTLNVQPVLDNANAVVLDARPRINESITQLNTSLVEAQNMILDMRTMIQDNNASMKRSMETVERNLVQLNEIIVKMDTMTTENRDEINAVLRNLLDASASVKDLAEHPWRIISGRKKQQQQDK
jgi:ABC-type transporter Mla subunit MlaD